MNFVEEEHVQSEEVGFLSLLNNALKWGREASSWGLSRWSLLKKGTFKVGKRGFPCSPKSREVESTFMDPWFVPVGPCGRRACFKWASGFSLAAEQSIEIRSRSMDLEFFKLDCLQKGHVQRGQVVSLAAKQTIEARSRSMDSGFVKLDFMQEGHVQSGQVGFFLLLNKALKWSQKAWISGLYKLDSLKKNMLRVGKWAFPCRWKSIEVRSRSINLELVQIGLCARRAC